MSKYKCKNCGHQCTKFVFQFNEYSYCIASNTAEPEFISDAPKWVKEKGVGEAKMGEPVGCLKCHAWGIHNFERTE